LSIIVGLEGGRKYIVMHRYELFLLGVTVMIASLACKEINFPHTCTLVLPANGISGERAGCIIAKRSSYYKRIPKYIYEEIDISTPGQTVACRYKINTRNRTLNTWFSMWSYLKIRDSSPARVDK